MSKIEEFKKYLRIDKLSLDEELVQQPALFYDISEAYVALAAIRDGLKEQLATVDARLDTAVRVRLEKTGKVTEAMVKNAIQLDDLHIAASDDYNRAKQAADEMSSLKEAFHQRAYMLRELCGLFTANYFERNSVSGSASVEAVQYDSKRTRLGRERSRID